MNAVLLLVLVLHWITLAVIGFGYFLSMRSLIPHPVMVWATRIQLILGLALVGIIEATHVTPLNHLKVGVKLATAVAVVALCEIGAARARKGNVTPALVHGAAAGVFANAVIALAWN